MTQGPIADHVAQRAATASAPRVRPDDRRPLSIRPLTSCVGRDATLGASTGRSLGGWLAAVRSCPRPWRLEVASGPPTWHAADLHKHGQSLIGCIIESLDETGLSTLTDRIRERSFELMRRAEVTRGRAAGHLALAVNPSS